MSLAGEASYCSRTDGQDVCCSFENEGDVMSIGGVSDGHLTRASFSFAHVKSTAAEEARQFFL